jgi:hypothetical protein
MKAGNLIGGTFMKKITLKRQPVFRRQPEQAVVRPDLVQRLDAVIQSLQPPAQPRDYLVELHRCLQSKQWKAQTLSIKKIGLLPHLRILKIFAILCKGAILYISFLPSNIFRFKSC